MKKRTLLTAIVVLTIVVLFARELHQWRGLQWSVFWHQISHLKWQHVILSLLLFYASFFIRAWRWKVFLENTHRTTMMRMLGPTFIGFTALALIGSPGEFTRPYLIARKEGISVSSQMGVWTVERIFDLGSFALLLLVAVFTVDVGLSHYVSQFRRFGLLLIVLIAVASVVTIQLQRHSGHLEQIVERLLDRIMPQFARSISKRVGTFGAGLNTFRDATTIFQQSALSLLMWAVIALAYFEVIRAFPPPLDTMPLAYATIVLGFAIFGGLVQLPAGATSQLMVIGALMNVFNVPVQLAVGCGIALWLGAYIAPVPVGLLYLRHEHLSLRSLSPSISASAATMVPGSDNA